MTGILLAAAALMMLFPHITGLWVIPVLLAYGFFFMASYPITEAALMEAVDESVRGRVFGLFLTICGLIANLSHWLVGDWVHKLGARATVPASYFPLYTGLGFLVVGSLAALPCLHALRKREEMIGPKTSHTHESPKLFPR
jgi:MFS family permease